MSDRKEVIIFAVICYQQIGYPPRPEPAGCAYRSPEVAFRTSEGPLLYRSHSNSHFVHQKGLSCTKVRGLAVDDERRDDGGFLPDRVRRSECGFLPYGGAGSKSERSPPAGRGKPPELLWRCVTGCFGCLPARLNGGYGPTQKKSGENREIFA